MPTHWLTSSGPLSAVLIAVLLLAVWFDVREKRIPNWLTASGLVISLLLRAIIGADALWAGLLGGGLGLSLGLLLFAAGGMGAGDGKLLTAVGSSLGLETFLWCLPLIGICGGLLALAVVIRQRALLSTLRRFRDLLFFLFTFGWSGGRRTLAAPGAVTIPYGVAVAAGAATAWLGWGLTL
jgi:prepilin peptidase CpaA